MNNSDFIEKIMGYYGMRAEVLTEISDLTLHMSDGDRAMLWDGLKFNVSPSKRIGVSDIFEMCAKKNLTMYAQKPVKLPVLEVVCEVCGKEFSWKLLCNDEDEKNFTFERCPRCGFFYEDTWVVKRYEDKVNDARQKYREPGEEYMPSDFGKEHREYVEKYKKRFAAGIVGPRAEVKQKTIGYTDYKAMAKKAV